MLIWINGTHAVGKTATVKKLAEKLGLDESNIVESDYCYREEFLRSRSFKEICAGTKAQNNEFFLTFLKNKIDTFLEEKNIVIVPMTITLKVGKEKIINYYLAKGNFVHIVLDAEKETVIKRAKEDKTNNRDVKASLEDIDNNLKFLDNNYNDAVRIKTDDLTVDEVVNKIFEVMKRVG